MAKKDYYETLGIKRSATVKELKQSFRRLARQYHPDVNPGNKDAEARFKEINEAYEVLSDPEKRKKYDQYGDQWQHADQFARAQPGGEAGQQWPSDFDQGRRGRGAPFGDIFEELFREAGPRGRGFRQRPLRGQDLEQPVEVPLEEAFRGTARIIQLQREEVCQTCQGKGILQKGVCPSCGGSGATTRLRRIEAKIPPGVQNGSRIRLECEGCQGAAGGPSGDLYMVMSVRPHPVFERKGDDLYLEIPLPLTEAVLGGELEVQTLKGKIVLKIPPETQNGKVFRLAGQGMPRLGGGGQGDLLVKVRVVLPTSLSEREKELFQQLKDLRPGVKV
ncbi:MAG: J domain-containing protein [Dehalococcoidia bacterium]|nr:J domain-containing protein [Dehalococcoidia bacterium]